MVDIDEAMSAFSVSPLLLVFQSLNCTAKGSHANGSSPPPDLGPSRLARENSCIQGIAAKLIVR